ncbi:hypothetical protein K8Q94_00745 [Candidatus Nomurabacteria bacterium]|nr:hypothetical protein [Candidatus Nomurabacteria bacterium]
MKKNLIQDINIKKNKVVQKEIPILKKDEFYVNTKSTSYQEDSRDYFLDKNKKKDVGSSFAIWFLALFAVIFLLFAVSFLFSNAKILITPKSQDVTLNENLSAVKDSNIDGVSFNLIALNGEESKTLHGGELHNVNLKAKGKVLLYNNFSTTPQSLAIDTRLEGSNGKLYKTDQKITIPGVNKTGVPGSIEVGIYANEAGEDYNSDPLDFKIFGFKGTNKYEKIYARSVGKINGGMVGQISEVSDSEKESALIDLKNSLQAKLIQKAQDQIPSGFILFKDAVFLSIEDQNSEYKEDVLNLNIKGTLYGILFNEDKLTQKIVNDVISKNSEDSVYIQNLKNLKFSLINSSDLIGISDLKNLSFNLSGPVKIIWNIDNDKIINDVLGQNKKDFNPIMSKYQNIDSADLIMRPIWKTSFPDKIKKIKININEIK